MNPVITDFKTTLTTPAPRQSGTDPDIAGECYFGGLSDFFANNSPIDTLERGAEKISRHPWITALFIQPAKKLASLFSHPGGKQGASKE